MRTGVSNSERPRCAAERVVSGAEHVQHVEVAGGQGNYDRSRRDVNCAVGRACRTANENLALSADLRQEPEPGEL